MKVCPRCGAPLWGVGDFRYCRMCGWKGDLNSLEEGDGW